MKDKKRLRESSGLKENKEVWQLYAMCVPRLDPGSEIISGTTG